MNLRLFWSLFRREARGQRGRLFFLAICLAVGVCAIVSVASLVAALREGTASRSRELLGGDVLIKSRRPLPDELDRLLEARGDVVQSRLWELPTMAAASSGAVRLVQIVAVEGPWPLFGRFRAEPADAGVLGGDDAIIAVESAVLADLGVEVGDEIMLGGRSFRIAARVLEAPEKSGFAFMLGPRVFMSRAGLERSGLLGFGSRLEYKALWRLEGAAPEAAREAALELEEKLPGAEYLDIRSHDEAEDRLVKPVEQAESYLGLVALLSLVLGGIGVARIVQAWIDSRRRGIAVMRCLGLRPLEVALVYLGQVLVLALVASLAGGLLGLLAPKLVSAFVGDVLPPGLLPPWQPQALIDGLLLGPLVALLFSLPALAALWRVSPARVFRSGVEPLPRPTLMLVLCWAVVAIGLFLAAWRRGGDALTAAIFVALLALAIALLALSALLLRLMLRLLPRERFELHLRHGLAALLRPAAGVQGALIALGLGTLVVSTILLVEDRLSQGIIQALPADAPTSFFIDVQPDQWPTLEAELRARGARAIDSVPVVMARLSSVDGRSVRDLAAEREEDEHRRRGWVLTREQRLTWLEGFDDSNRIVSGEPFGADPGPEVSLEKRFARDLGARLGSILVFDVQGIPIEMKVTSLREVEWASFRINFFLVAEPGVLNDAPHYRIATARLEGPAEASFERELATILPNVSMIKIRAILQRVAAILEGLVAGIAALGSFTVLAGLGILAGCVSSGSLRRARETALLKVLGLRPRGVLLLLLVEFGVLGLVSGVLGALGGLGLAWAFGMEFELEGSTRWELALWIVLAVTLLTALAGSLAAGRALGARPRLVLAGD